MPLFPSGRHTRGMAMFVCSEQIAGSLAFQSSTVLQMNVPRTEIDCSFVTSSAMVYSPINEMLFLFRSDIGVTCN